MTKTERTRLARVTALVLAAHNTLVTRHYELPPEKRPPRGATSEIDDLYRAWKILKAMEEKRNE